MCKRLAWQRVVWLYLISLFLVQPLSAQKFKLKSGQSVYVMAVRDSRLFTMCPGPDAISLPSSGAMDRSATRVTYLPNGMEHIVIPESYTDETFSDQVIRLNNDPRARPPRILYWDQRIILPAPANRQQVTASSSRYHIELDRIALDGELKTKIEKEFVKEKRYKVVESAERADFVFLVEGYYTATASWNRGSSEITIEDIDERPNLLKAALAIALPTADFQHHFGDGAGLVKAKLWQGSVITREALPRQQTVDSSKPTKHEIVPAAAESLVRQFHNKEKEPTNYPPVCGATPGRMQLPSVKDLPEATRSKQILAGDSVTIPSVSSAQARKPSTDNKAIKVEVSLVTVPVFVGNKDGNYLPGLKPSDFHVFEDNVEQKIDRLLPEGDPNNIALLIDTSDSMGWADGRPDGRPAAISSLVSLLRSDDRLMLVSFNDRIFVDAEFTNDHEQLVHAGTKAEIFPATRLYDAVDLVKTDRLDQVPGRKVMILITDGVDTRSRIADSVSTLKGVEEGNLLIYVIQCRADSNPAIVKGLPAGLVSPRTGWIPSFLNKALEGQENRYAGADKYLQNLSTGSGGELYFAAAPGDVKDILAHIADELGHEYTICYYPSNARSDASYHHLHVTVDVPGLQIRARQGYRAR